MEALRHEYWLPTYGIAYPTTTDGENSSTVISRRLYRPVEYKRRTKLLDALRSGKKWTVMVEDEEEETVGERNLEPDKTTAFTISEEPRAVVQNQELWKSFMKIGNEMIVTKPGRCLFPTLLVSLYALHPKKLYKISLKISPMDSVRYKYLDMAWTPAGISDILQSREKQVYTHPYSPTTGQFWMKRPISFKSVKITHHANSKNGNILLHTMHKYVIEIIVEPQDETPPITLVLPETAFIAVSAYQNSEVIKLKIDHNPFAKAFKYQEKTPALDQGSPVSSTTASHKQPTKRAEKPYSNELYTIPGSTLCGPFMCHAPPLVHALTPTSPAMPLPPMWTTPIPDLGMPNNRNFLPYPTLFPLPTLLPGVMAIPSPPATPLAPPYLLLTLCGQVAPVNTVGMATKAGQRNDAKARKDEPMA